MAEKTVDIVLCKFGQDYDWMEIDTSCNYVVDTIEPFLNIRLNKENPIAKTKLTFGNKDGKTYHEKVSDILNGGIKLYYHDKPMAFDLEKYPGKRKAGLMESLLEEIEVLVTQHQLT